MSRRRIALAVLFVTAVAVAAGIYAFSAPKRYVATARVVVHPIPPTDSTFTGIDVLRATGDTPRDLETAASFFSTPDVISTTATRLSLTRSQVSKSLDVHPLGGANVLLVVGTSSTPALAAQIANGIVQEAISQRTARVQAQVSAVLDKLRKSKSPDAQRRIVDLEALQSRPDPTLETLSAATAPTNPSSPRRALIVVSASAGALAVAAAFLLLSSVLTSLRRRPAKSAAPEPLPASVSNRDEDQALTRRAAAIDQRERELQQVVTEAKDAIAERERALKREVAERERAVADENAKRRRELAADAAERERLLAERAAELARREEEAAERAAEAARVAVPEPVPEPRPESARSVEGLESSETEAAPLPVSEAESTPIFPGPPWTIPLLEQLIDRRGAEFPDRVDEWRYYVVFLSEHADEQGALPASFDYLVDDTFAELL